MAGTTRVDGCSGGEGGGEEVAWVSYFALEINIIKSKKDMTKEGWGGLTLL